MAESKKNIATEGLSGRVGNFIFRRRKSDDKIFVARRPVASEDEPTEAQVNIRRKFQRGIIYGKSAMANPVTKALYAQLRPPVGVQPSTWPLPITLMRRKSNRSTWTGTPARLAVSLPSR